MMIGMGSKSILCVSVTLLGLSLLHASTVSVVGADLLRVRKDQPLNTAESGVNTNQQPLSVTSQQCVPFHHPYCSRFGYNYTISPNPWARGLMLEQVETEFNDFSGLLSNNCSSVLGIFLCFTYFPLCYGNRQVILPCKEVCEEVHASRCNDLVLNSVGEWAQHLRCSNFRLKSETQNGNCADGGQDMTGGDEVIMTTVPPLVTTKAVKEITTTEKKESEVDNCKGLKCRSTCVVRPKSTAGTFKSNNLYNFAAKVLVQHKLASASHCKHAYQVEVLQQFNLSSSNKYGVTYAPAMSQHIILHTSPYKCNTCPNLITGSRYLIAGQYQIGDDGVTMWELPNGRSQSLASEWKGKIGVKYDKKLSGWIADANKHRLQTSAN